MFNGGRFNRTRFNGRRGLALSSTPYGIPDPGWSSAARIGPDPGWSSAARIGPDPGWSSAARIGPDPRQSHAAFKE